MTDILKLSVFNTLQSYESKPLTLESILWWISHDKSVAQKTELYRNMALAISPEEAKKKVKEAMMPAFSVAVVFQDRGRQTQHVASVTGLSLCDIDHIDQVDEVFQKIAADPHTLLLYRTISGKGLRCIYRYVDENGKPPQNALLYRRRCSCPDPHPLHGLPLSEDSIRTYCVDPSSYVYHISLARKSP